jgi:peptide deformylase
LGIDASVCIILLDRIPTVLINPEIIDRSLDTFNISEGCLSIPGKTVLVRRHTWVKVKADNLPEPKVFGLDLTRVTGKAYERMLLESSCVSHEVDHVFGILIFDRAV